ncbi:MAG: glucose-6-phosphate isomerase family protein [Patescibacteria group bacterium]
MNLENRTPNIRRLNDMKAVIYDKEWLKTAENLELYYMYRSVEKKDGLVYDVTVIPSNMLGKEFVKTKGHDHPKDFNELYMVLEGEAIFLAQKVENGKIKDVFVVEAKKGDSVIIPAHYGHITINPSQKELIMANWISKNCKGIYDLFEKMQGACYYYTQNGWIKNNNYSDIPTLRFEKPLKSMPKNLNFLKK